MGGEADLDTIAERLRATRYVTVLTGAGISTDSGIPDFRGPNGVWTKNPDAEKAAQIEYYMNDPELRKRAWQNRLSSGMWSASPNAAHDALVDLERKDALHALVTQNVDGLHHAAGQSPELVVEIHGNVREGEVHVVPVARPDGSDARPRARRRRRPALHMRRDPEVGDDQLRREPRARGSAPLPARGGARDVFLAIGTSLVVFPAAGLPEIAVRNGARLVILNAEETPFDPVADFVVRDQLGDVLPELAKRV